MIKYLCYPLPFTLFVWLPPFYHFGCLAVNGDVKGRKGKKICKQSLCPKREKDEP